MRTSHIDGIYRQEARRRYEVERRLVVPVRTPVSAATQLQPTTTGAPVTSGAITSSAAKPGRTLSMDGIMQAPPNVAAMPHVPQPAQTAADMAATHSASNAPAVESAPPDRAILTRRSRVVSASFVTIAVLVLVGSGLLGYQTWRTNVDARAAFSAPVTTASSDEADVSGTAADSAPSEAEVPDEAKKQYTVAADLPRTISIDSLGVHARVLRMSVTNDGAIQAPTGIWDAGWYDGSAKPGQGNTFIDGHISGPTMPAVFAKLKDIKNGATITIERGDGAKLTYAVASVSTQKLTDIDMKALLAGPGGDTLTVMTCGGSYQDNYSYDSRVIVVAKRI